jgi:hypothetical protein
MKRVVLAGTSLVLLLSLLMPSGGSLAKTSGPQVTSILLYASSAPLNSKAPAINNCPFPKVLPKKSFKTSTANVDALLALGNWSGPHVLRMSWIAPGGTVFLSSAKLFRSLREACSRLPVSGHEPATMPGAWAFEARIDGHLKKRVSFAVQVPPTATPTPTSTPTPAPTDTPTPTSTPIETAIPVLSPTPLPTNTPVLPTATPAPMATATAPSVSAGTGAIATCQDPTANTILDTGDYVYARVGPFEIATSDEHGNPAPAGKLFLFVHVSETTYQGALFPSTYAHFDLDEAPQTPDPSGPPEQANGGMGVGILTRAGQTNAGWIRFTIPALNGSYTVTWNEHPAALVTVTTKPLTVARADVEPACVGPGPLP